jgi:hypothetical protein
LFTAGHDKIDKGRKMSKYVLQQTDFHVSAEKNIEIAKNIIFLR